MSGLENVPLKIMLLGDPQVGKTTIFTHFITGTFTSNSVHLRLDRYKGWTKTFTVDGKDTTVSN